MPNELLIENLCTQGYHLIDNFMPPTDYQKLRTIAQTMHDTNQLQDAKIGQYLEKKQNNTIRTDKISWLDEHVSEPAIQAYLQKVHTLVTFINQHLFLSLIELEAHFAVYPPGAFYKKHVDQFNTNKNRKISCVYYLNEQWTDQFGGHLKLYSPEDRLLQEIGPQGNRFICFNSELPHEVCLTHQTRYSITGWMKTRL